MPSERTGLASWPSWDGVLTAANLDGIEEQPEDKASGEVERLDDELAEAIGAEIVDRSSPEADVREEADGRSPRRRSGRPNGCRSRRSRSDRGSPSPRGADVEAWAGRLA